MHEVIRTWWYSVDWDVEAIWALELPAAPFPVAELLWHLDCPVWSHRGRPYAVTPRQVLDDPVAHAEEATRIARADLAFPIDVLRRRDRWMILDGIHRLAKASAAGHATIMARRVPPSAVRFL